jgi:hypothetical protein
MVNRNSPLAPVNGLTVKGPSWRYDANRVVRAEHVVPITATDRTGAQQAVASIPQGVLEQSHRPDDGISSRISGPRHSQQPARSGEILRDSGCHSRASISRPEPHRPAIEARSEAVDRTTSSDAAVAITGVKLPKKSLKNFLGNSFGRARGSFSSLFKSSKESAKTENAADCSSQQRREAQPNGFMKGLSQKSGFRDFQHDTVMRELDQITSAARSRITQAPVTSESNGPTQVPSRMAPNRGSVARSHVDSELMLAQCLGGVTHALVLPTF